MTSAVMVLLACLAGGLGAALRHLGETAVQRRVRDGFPWGTLVVNATGSFAGGVLVRVCADLGDTTGPRVALVLSLGLLGGFTTFSSAMLQSLEVGRARGSGAGAVHAAGTWLLCVAAAALGMGLAG